jgi:hypothetical protein
MQFCICNCCYAQKEILDKKRYVVWKENLDFSWDYFLLPPPKNNIKEAAAIITTSISWSTKTKEKKDIVICYVQTYLDKKKSWSLYRKNKKITFFESRRLLNHERGHFNMTEIYAREGRMLISKIKVKSFNEVYKEIQKIAKIIDERRKENKYDEETEHGKNKEKQAEWDKKIAERLKELEQYKDIAVVIRLQ